MTASQLPIWSRFSPETLAEVGRLTLAAIDLEISASLLCARLLGEGVRSRLPISSRIAAARTAVLGGGGMQPRGSHLIEWLDEVAALFALRNAFLHGIPTGFSQPLDAPSDPQLAGMWLVHYPRSGETPPIHQRITADDIAALRVRFDQAYADGYNIGLPTTTRRDVPN